MIWYALGNETKNSSMPKLIKVDDSLVKDFEEKYKDKIIRKASSLRELIEIITIRKTVRETTTVRKVKM